MNKVNYTDYKTKPGEYIAYFGKAYLQNGYMFVNGDETFYHLVGGNSCFSILDLLHPDDVDDFKETLSLLSNGRQCVIVRMRDADDKYRLLYMELWLNGRIIDGFESITLEFSNIMELKDRYIAYNNLVKKYRTFLGLSTKLFFEYTYDKDELNIYYYAGILSKRVLKKKLEDICRELEASDVYSQSEKGEFEVFCNFLHKGVDTFKTSFNARLIEKENDGRYNIKGSTMFGEENRCIGIIDVTDRVNEKKSYYLTDNALDPGTGIWNKRAIHEYAVEKTLLGKEFYLAIIDIDDFKQINDNYGHMFGDEVILKVTEIIRATLNTRGMLGRFGGDEFMIVFDGVTKEDELRRMLKAISKNMHWMYRGMEPSLTVTNSCGVAKYPQDGTNFEELFQKADKALYIAKAKGKNRYIIYEEKKHGAIVNQESGEHIIGIKAIASDEKKAAVMSEAVISLHHDGVKAFDDVIEKMRSHFDIDGVAIYCGPEMNRALSSGKYINPIKNLTWVNDPVYLELFDTQGIYAEGNMKRLSSHYAQAYHMYELQETQKVIQCMAYENGRPAAVVSFDYFNRSPKVGAFDLGLITIVGRLMADIACGLE